MAATRLSHEGAGIILPLVDQPRSVLDYWFGRRPFTADAIAERMRFWFGGKDPAEVVSLRDREIERRFAGAMQRALDGELDSWGSSPRRRLALILLLDQFPRNVYRRQGRAYGGDEKALQLALSGVQRGADATLDPVERIFFFMPLQHSESPEAQEESVAAFRRLRNESPPALRKFFEITLGYAELHRNIVRKFGRFPHRNAALKRKSTPAEELYLRNAAERFGQ
jgi:uncharacterized protein (DUF924 family)